MHIRKIAQEVMDLMHLAQERKQWQAVVNTVMNLWIPKKVENFLTN
jgi:hypothetical protein